MRIPLAAACCVVLAACGGAQEKPKPPPDEKEKKGLSVGDAAPPLTVTSWLAGTPVKTFESGKVYVVEFWATWCGPCIASMPHLGGLQAEFKDQGLVIVGVTNKDENNTKEKVDKFVEKRGKRYGYTFAWCDTGATYGAYMDASGQDGIPCSFVVDKAGKLAFIGHPAELDGVLPKVLAGTWTGEADIKALRAANKAADEELQKIFRQLDKDPAAVLTGLAEFAKKNPDRAKQDLFKLRVVVAQLKAKKLEEAKAGSEELVKAATARSNGEVLGYVASVWTDTDLNPDKKYHDLAIKAVDAILKLDGDDDLGALMTAAQVYKAMGQTDKALDYVGKAIKAADNPRVKAELEKVAEEFKKK
jgi:thiol-disulfide isomerase/thioredoxin